MKIHIRGSIGLALLVCLSGPIHADPIKIACKCESSSYGSGCGSTQYFLIDDSKHKVTLIQDAEEYIFPSSKLESFGRLTYTIHTLDSNYIRLTIDWAGDAEDRFVIDRSTGELSLATYKSGGYPGRSMKGSCSKVAGNPGF